MVDDGTGEHDFLNSSMKEKVPSHKHCILLRKNLFSGIACAVT